MDIRFHSPANPKSSQLLALNLFLLGERLGDGFFRTLLRDGTLTDVRVRFEWIDDANVLRQGGNPSNHDVLLDAGHRKYLIEMKFTEHADAPCGSSKKNDECRNKATRLRCPLEEAYGTLYYPLLRGPSSPYRLAALEMHYADCPFLHGEQYQIMRYILLAQAKSTDSEHWIPGIIFPRQNLYMDREINLTKECLREPENLRRIYLEEAVEVMREFSEPYAAWLRERYQP